ncbi:F-box protein CPR1-like [Impatiens glandulifera]|uniref:F-box protein CPR1-like n=1 Tax=Impatiens glandulifera TaxID=253017 RepID=UPI001FB15B4D|nr:F-box protein CPR1-like [Impatiens glandulifera]
MPLTVPFIWNPSTRMSIKLPYESTDIAIHPGLCTSCVYRIGYDNTNDDYKVVRIVVYLILGFGIEYEIKVYSLRSNSWHRPEKFPHCPNWKSFGNSIVCGSLHWISTVKSEKSDLKEESLIVAFDIGTEKYRVLPQPQYRGPYYKLYVDDLGECLSLSCHYKSSTVDMFLLKEYGGKNEHWSRLINATLLKEYGGTNESWLRLAQNIPVPSNHVVKSAAYSNCGKNVLLSMDDDNLVWYDLDSESLEDPRIHADENYSFEVETLAWKIYYDVAEAG